MVRVFSDKFLFPQNAFDQNVSSCSSGEDWLICHASADARDDFANLADMVGSGATLDEDYKADADNGIDLEAELARALGGNPTSQYDQMSSGEALITTPEPPADDVPVVPFEVQEATVVPVESSIETPVVETEVGEEALPNMEFGDLISAEFDRALAEEEALAAQLEQDMALEFAQDEQMAEIAIEPALEPIVDVPPVVDAGPVVEPATNFSDPIEELGLEPARVAPQPPVVTAPPTQAPPQMAAAQTPVFRAPVPESDFAADQDFSDPAAAFQNFPHFQPEVTPAELPHIEPLAVESVAPPAPVEEPAADYSIDAVLGASAALGAAAIASTVKQEPPLEDGSFDLDQPVDAPLVMEAPAISSSPAVDEMDIAFDPQVNALHDDVVMPPPAFIPQEARSNGGRRVAFAVLAVALLGGLGALAWNSFGGPTGEAPTILAEATPVKVKPKDSGGKVVPNQDRTVYEKVGGAESSAPAQTALKDATEKPIAMAKVKPKVKPAATSAKPDQPIVLKPRAVRTVVVKPDGTIVTRETVGTSQPAEVAKVAVKDAETTGGVKFTPPSENAVEPVAAPKQVAKLVPAKPVKLKPVKPAAKPKPAAKVKVVKPKPAKKVVAKKPATAKPVALPSVKSPYAVQISSRRTPEAAKSAWTKLARRYGSVLGKYNPDIRAKKISGRGTFYQVRVPANSKSAANTICSRLKKAGGDCFVTR